MDTYAHDGVAWRKARHIYMHDGVAWRKAREVWAASPTWQCVYQDREFIELDATKTGVNSIRECSLGLLVASSLGVYLYNGSWTRLGTVTGAVDAIEIGITLYCATPLEVYRWDGATWVPAGSTAMRDRYSLAESGGRLIAMATGASTYVLSGSTWTLFGIQLQSAWKCKSNGVCYGINGSFLYNVDSLALIADSGDLFGHLHVYAKDANSIYVDGTGGLKKWNGSSFTTLTTADSRVLMSEDDRGDVLTCRSFSPSQCTRWNASDASGPVGASDLRISISNAGRPRAAKVGDTVYALHFRTSPSRTTVSEFRLK